MQDQTTYPFWFQITPIEIKNSHMQRPSKAQTKKSVLIKLGTKQGKTKELNQPIELIVDILYSKTLKKFCPIKGIIKIYDINADGSQMISCVGSFNTEELTNKHESEVIVERDIGHYKIKMKVSGKQMGKEQQEDDDEKFEQPLIISSKADIGSPKKMRDSFSSNRLNGEGSRQSNFMRGTDKISEELDCHETPYIMDDSMQMQEEVSCSEYSEDMRRNQKDLIGEQLVEQRRNNKILQDKLEKANMKINLLKKNLAQKTAQIKSYINKFKQFTNILEYDRNGQYIFEMNERRRQLSLKFKQNTQFKQNFTQFLNFMTKKIQQIGSPTTSIQNIGIQRANSDMEESSNKLMKKIQQDESQRQKMMEQNKVLTIQVNRLKNQLKCLQSERNKQKTKIKQLMAEKQREQRQQARGKIINNNNSAATRELQFTLVKKNDQILILQSKLKKANEEKRSLEGMNQYLQQKDTHMESIINSKENTIENLKRMINDTSAELDVLEQKNTKLQKMVNNFQLTIEEMKEQNANLLETIDQYRQKYGDLKAAKDKALERELRDCLRWIDQQNRDQQLSLEQNTLSFTDTTHNMTSIMKGIDQIQNMPLQEISVIRKEVVNVLKKLDQLLARNVM